MRIRGENGSDRNIASSSGDEKCAVVWEVNLSFGGVLAAMVMPLALVQGSVTLMSTALLLPAVRAACSSYLRVRRIHAR